VPLTLYDELPVFRDVYRLTLRMHQLTQGFSREFKFTLGQDMKRDCLGLLRSIYRVNRSRDKAPLLDTFLDDFELLKLEVRLCADLKLFSLRQQAELIEGHLPSTTERQAFRVTINSYLGVMGHFDTRRLRRSMVGKYVRDWWKYAHTNGDVSKIVLRPNVGVSSVE